MSCETATRLSCYAFQIPALCSSQPPLYQTLIAPSTLFPLSVPVFVCISFPSVLLLVVCLSFVKFSSSTSGTICSDDVILWHSSFPDPQVSGVEKGEMSLTRNMRMFELGCTAHYDWAVYTAGLNWNQGNGWIQGWAGLIWCHILCIQMEKLLHTEGFT